MSDHHHRRLAFARLLSSAVVSQALLSAASFAIGLILVRSTSDAEYGYYILASSAIMLLVSLQNAFFSPPLAIRISQLGVQGRRELVGGLYREQRRWLPLLAGAVILMALGLWFAAVLDTHTLPLVLASVVASLAILNREYFRMVLFAHRRPSAVLRMDAFYVVLLVAGVLLAILTPVPAVATIFTLGLAAMVSGILLARTVRRFEPWDNQGAPHILRDIAPLAAWSTAGAAIHWTFSHGYIYLVAGTLNVAAVAAIAATRLLLMPVNLLATGIGSLMLPLASGWLQRHGAALLWRRLCLFALGMVVVALCYFAVLWWLREWIFSAILQKQFAQRDQLLLLWGAVFLVIVIRDQLVYLLAAQGRFRDLSYLTLACALIALIASYAGMLLYGVPGALVGMLIGEVINLTGVVILSLRTMAEPSGVPLGVQT